MSRKPTPRHTIIHTITKLLKAMDIVYFEEIAEKQVASEKETLT